MKIWGWKGEGQWESWKLWTNYMWIKQFYLFSIIKEKPGAKYWDSRKCPEGKAYPLKVLADSNAITFERRGPAMGILLKEHPDPKWPPGDMFFPASVSEAHRGRCSCGTKGQTTSQADSRTCRIIHTVLILQTWTIQLWGVLEACTTIPKSLWCQPVCGKF